MKGRRIRDGVVDATIFHDVDKCHTSRNRSLKYKTRPTEPAGFSLPKRSGPSALRGISPGLQVYSSCERTKS
jgi:hypothetical protein